MINELKKYDRSKVRIQPRIMNLVLCSRIRNKTNFPLSFNTGVPSNVGSMSNIKLERELFETIVFQICLALENSTRTESLSIVEEQVVYFELLLLALSNSASVDTIKCDIEKRLGICIREDARHLLAETTGDSTSVPKVIELGVLTFYVICSKLQKSHTITNDLIPWIKSITASSIRESHSFLSKAKDPPAFILLDLMLRNPLFKEELILQCEVWKYNLKPFAMCSLQTPSILKKCIDNLMYHSLDFEPHLLDGIIQTSFEFFKSKRTGVNIELDNTFINDLTWSLAVYASRQSNVTRLGVASAQESLVKYLSTGTGSPYQRINLRAYMGIIVMIADISPEKAHSLMAIVEKRFLDREDLSMKDMVAYHVGKVCLATSPEELVEEFNTAFKEYSKSSSLWLFFIRKLESFGLLDMNRSVRILERIAQSEAILLKDIVNILLRPVEDMKVLEKMIHICRHKAEQPPNLIDVFFPKYVDLLYRYKQQGKRVKLLHFWDRDRAADEIPIENLEDYVSRLIKANCARSSISSIGMMLKCEYKVNPCNVFAVYKRELLDKQLSPNNNALKILILAALKQSNDLWGDLFAPQVAINQFLTHVKHSVNDNELGLTPSNGLWRAYIRLLMNNSYISELSKILKWWEDIKFTPDKETLMMLLIALPEEFTNRHIQHQEKLRKESLLYEKMNWDWPTRQQLMDYRRRRSM